MKARRSIAKPKGGTAIHEPTPAQLREKIASGARRLLMEAIDGNDEAGERLRELAQTLKRAGEEAMARVRAKRNGITTAQDRSRKHASIINRSLGLAVTQRELSEWAALDAQIREALKTGDRIEPGHYVARLVDGLLHVELNDLSELENIPF